MRLRTPWPIARSRQRVREFAAVFASVPPGSLGDMLEVGSGDGFMASLLAPLGTRLVTSEPTTGVASHARELPRLRCSVTALPLPDASFDFIFSSSVLEHVRDREQAMAEMRRVLRPHGVMVHLMPAPACREEVMATLSVDEIVITSTSVSGGDLRVDVRIAAKGQPLKAASTTIPVVDSSDAGIDAGLGPLFGVKAKAPDKPVAVSTN